MRRQPGFSLSIGGQALSKSRPSQISLAFVALEIFDVLFFSAHMGQPQYDDPKYNQWHYGDIDFVFYDGPIRGKECGDFTYHNRFKVALPLWRTDNYKHIQCADEHADGMDKLSVLLQTDT